MDDANPKQLHAIFLTFSKVLCQARLELTGRVAKRSSISTAGSAPIVGKTIQVDDQAFAVVGVLERAFRVPIAAAMAPPALWTTFANRRDMWRERKAAATRRMEIELKELEVLHAANSAPARRMQEPQESADIWCRLEPIGRRVRSSGGRITVGRPALPKAENPGRG